MSEAAIVKSKHVRALEVLHVTLQENARLRKESEEKAKEFESTLERERDQVQRETTEKMQVEVDKLRDALAQQVLSTEAARKDLASAQSILPELTAARERMAALERELAQAQAAARRAGRNEAAEAELAAVRKREQAATTEVRKLKTALDAARDRQAAAEAQLRAATAQSALELARAREEAAAAAAEQQAEAERLRRRLVAAKTDADAVTELRTKLKQAEDAAQRARDDAASHAIAAERAHAHIEEQDDRIQALEAKLRGREGSAFAKYIDVAEENKKLQKAVKTLKKEVKGKPGRRSLRKQADVVRAVSSLRASAQKFPSSAALQS